MKTLSNGMTRRVLAFFGANNPKRFGFGTQGRKIGSDVASATQPLALLYKVNDGNSGLWREARRASPHVAIQHQIANHTEALPAETRKQPFQPWNG